MSRTSRIIDALAAAAVIAATAGCEKSADILRPGTPIGGDLFRSYVALGNSITAGFQSGGINDSTQQQSYANLLALQVHTRFAMPLLAPPGCPPPIVNFQTQQRLDSTTAQTCALRDAASVTGVINDVAVPGAAVIDPTTAATVNSTILTQLILGGKTQVARALDADPSFVSIWIGNNDVLVAGVTGLLNPTPGVSPGVTPPATFQSSYDQMIQQLQGGAHHLKGGVLIGVVNVANAPVLFPARALFDPRFKAGFDLYAGGPVTILPSCTPTSTALISFLIVGAMRSGSHPRDVGCAPNSIPGTLVGDIFVLDSAEQVSLASTIGTYNSYIQQKAGTLGWAYYDPNPDLSKLRGSGAIPTVPNLASATQPFGPYVSLDGIHPAAPAHVLIANGLIQAINAKYSLSIPQLPTPSARLAAHLTLPRHGPSLRRPAPRRRPEA